MPIVDKEHEKNANNKKIIITYLEQNSLQLFTNQFCFLALSKKGDKKVHFSA